MKEKERFSVDMFHAVFLILTCLPLQMPKLGWAIEFTRWLVLLVQMDGSSIDKNSVPDERDDAQYQLLVVSIESVRPSNTRQVTEDSIPYIPRMTRTSDHTERLPSPEAG